MPLAPDEGDFAAARLTAYRATSATLQDLVSNALGGLNEKVLNEITAFLRSSIKGTQRAWARDAAPPYTELPVAFVQTSCHLADLPLALRQLQRHVRVSCSPHVAILHSKECGTLVGATRSLVAQLIGQTARTATGCSFDMGVLAGWYADLSAGRVQARVRPLTHAASAPMTGGITPLVVIIEDAGHFAPDVLNDLIYSLATARSHDGAPLPICLVFALSAVSPRLSPRSRRSPRSRLFRCSTHSVSSRATHRIAGPQPAVHLRYPPACSYR